MVIAVGASLLASVVAFSPVSAVVPQVVDGGQLGTGGDDIALGLDADANGIYVAGARAGLGGRTGFFRMLKPGGATAWTHLLSTAGDDEYKAVRATPDAIYVAGATTGDVAHPNATPRGDYDVVVERLSRSTGARSRTVHRSRVRTPVTGTDSFVGWTRLATPCGQGSGGPPSTTMRPALPFLEMRSSRVG